MYELGGTTGLTAPLIVTRELMKATSAVLVENLGLNAALR